MACPVKDESWKRLVNYLGNENDAYRIYNAHNQSIPEIPKLTEFKSKIKYANVIYNEASKARMLFFIDQYNQKHNTSHSLKFETNTPSSEKVKIIFNFMPKRVMSKIPNNGLETKKSSAEVEVQSTKKYSNIFVSEGNEYITNGELYPSYEDAENAVYRNKINPKESKSFLRASQIKGETVGEVLDNIIRNSDKEYSKIIAKLFSKYSSYTKIKVLTSTEYDYETTKHHKKSYPEQQFESFVDSSGVYFHDIDTIFIRESASERTMLHEIAHALTVHAIQNDTVGKSFNSFFEITKAKLIDLGVDETSYFLKNSKEFISEFFSNTHLVNLLKTIPSDKKTTFKTLYNELIDFLQKIFGVSNNTLYEEALNNIVEVMDQNEAIILVNNIPLDPSLPSRSVNTIQDLKKTLEKTSKQLKNKAGILSKSASNTANKVSRVLYTLSSDLERKIASNEYSEAIVNFLEDIINNEFNFMLRDIASHKEGLEFVNTGYLNRMNSAIKFYSKIVKDIDAIINDNREDDMFVKIRQITEPHIDAFRKQMYMIDSFVKSETRRTSIKTLKSILGDDYDESFEGLLDKVDSDVNGLQVLFGSLIDTSDIIGKTIYKHIITQIIDSEQQTIEVGKKLVNMQLNLEANGIKDLSVLQEEYDGVKTGYLISEYNWGEFYIEQKKKDDNIRREMKEKFGYESADIPPYQDMTESEKAIHNKYNKPFIAKYMRDSYQDFGYVPNPPKNPKFEEIKKNQLLYSFYTEYKQTMFRAKELLPKQYRESDSARLLLAQIPSDLMEVLKSKENLFSKLKIKAKENFVTTAKDIDYGSQEILYDESGNIAKLVPIHYVKKLENPKDLSKDMTSMAIAFFHMAHKFQGLSNRLEDVIVIQRSLEEREFRSGRKGGKYLQSNIAKMIENFLDIQVYGIKEDPILAKIPGTDKEVNITKVLNNILNHVRKVNLFFSIPTTVSGTIKSTIDLNLDKFIGNHITFESSRWAEKEFWKAMPSIIENVGKRQKTGKVPLLFEKVGIYGDVSEIFDRLNQTDKLSRMHSSDFTYFTYEIADTKIKGKIALAVFNNYRFVDGKFITKKQFDRKYKEDNQKKWSDYENNTLYDAYEVINNQLVVKKEFKKHVTPQLEAEVIYIIKDRSAVIAGQLTQYDRPEIARSTLGKFLLLHRNWMVSGITERMKKGGLNPMTHEHEEGYYRSTAILINRMIHESGNLQQRLAVWDKLEDYQKANVLKTMYDFAFMVTALLLSHLLMELAEDEPDDYWIQYLTFQMNRIRLEQNAFWGVKEFFSILNSPTPASSFLTTVTSVAKLLTNREEIEYGAYEGMYQYQKAIIKNTRLKNLWEIRNVESLKQKNKYLSGMIL